MADDGDTDDKIALLQSLLGNSIDLSTFEQIMDMDEDDDRDFSSSIVFGFFEQAENTMDIMDEALEEKDLDTLASQGHFLKGSSATLGLTIMQEACEKIQHLGHKKDEMGAEDRDAKFCLDAIAKECGVLRKEYIVVKAGLSKFFDVKK